MPDHLSDVARAPGVYGVLIAVIAVVYVGINYDRIASNVSGLIDRLVRRKP